MRDLAERGELEGAPGAYVCVREVRDIHVPASLQAIIGARIDRLSATAKRTLHAAAVIGAQFDTELLKCLLDSVDVTPLIEAATRRTGRLHAARDICVLPSAYSGGGIRIPIEGRAGGAAPRVAEVMQRTQGGFTGQEAAIVATQYAAAGDLRDAYEWHMQAATWYGARDIRGGPGELATGASSRRPAARRRPRSADHADRPRALLCGSAFQVGGTPADTGFDELRELTTAAGDKKSLAIGMAGHLTTLTFNAHHARSGQPWRRNSPPSSNRSAIRR